MEIFAAAAAITALGALFLLRGLFSMFRKPVSGMFGGVFGLALGAIGAGAGLFGLNIQTFSRLTTEQEVAVITLQEVGPRSFEATLAYPDGTAQTFPLTGDQWRLEAQVVKWKPWANVVLGRDALYRLDRLSGRYINPSEERANPPSVHDLRGPPENQLIAYAEDVGRYFHGVDATFGSGTYLPMVDGAAYQVSLTQDALIARPNNEIASRAAPSLGAPR